MVAQGDQGPIQGFSMLGDYEGRHLDGVGGALVAATTLFFYSTTPTSRIRLCCCACARPTARCCKRLPVAIAAQGSIVGTLSNLFGSSVEIDEGYVQVQSTLPLRGFDFLAGSYDFSSMTAQVGVQTRQLVVPRLFVDNHGGDTEIRLLNVGDTEALVQIQARDDRS